MISFNILKNMSTAIQEACAALDAFLALPHKPEQKENAVYDQVMAALKTTLEACRAALPELPDTTFTRYATPVAWFVSRC